MRLRNALARLALLAVLPALLGACGSLIVTQRSLAYLEGRTGFEWRSRAADGFVVHVEADSATEPDHERILAAAREARGSVLAYLGEPTYEPVVHVFAVDDRARMRALIGRETNAMAYYRSNSLCLVWPRSGRSGVHHELLHVVAMNRWGVPERWVNEGAAVDATASRALAPTPPPGASCATCARRTDGTRCARCGRGGATPCGR